MTLNRVKLGRAVTFMKYLASVVSLIFLPKILIWNKITFPTSDLLNFAELVGNELKSISKKVYQYSFFYPIYRRSKNKEQSTIIITAHLSYHWKSTIKMSKYEKRGFYRLDNLWSMKCMPKMKKQTQNQLTILDFTTLKRCNLEHGAPFSWL